MGINRKFWLGKKVFLTGHTGFKGSWLALWLTDMGAEVYGYALSPSTEPNLFSTCGVQRCLCSSTIANIMHSSELLQSMQRSQAEIVFHLAAQPLVRYAYANPAETYATNIMGTVHVLDAIRYTTSVKAVINVTSDKCYENQEWCWPYRENETLGGIDPYSSSKACAELITASYRRSFFQKSGVALATARAGNVVGGGDWAPDRLIPDILRAHEAKETLTIRSPQAVRPWQHVLEPLAGYIMLAERLYSDGQQFAEPWNFGPADKDTRSVQWIIETIARRLPNTVWQCTTMPQPHEANILRLDSSKAKIKLGWYPRWNLHNALENTIAWHKAWKNGDDMKKMSLQQIHSYESVERAG
jgi:CDP-glucose 4,6-dehydratase